MALRRGWRVLPLLAMTSLALIPSVVLPLGGTGFPDAVAEQFARVRRDVLAYKDHPAVLLWAVGNEMEGDGTNPDIWKAVEEIAREIKRIDPDHPTMTVIAELGSDKVESIERFCPSIDIVGVNSYGGITTVGARYRAAGGSKPYDETLELGHLHSPFEAGALEGAVALASRRTEPSRLSMRRDSAA